MRYVYMVLALCFAAFVHAGATIGGKVVDENGRALKRVRVWSKPETKQAQTNSIGRYYLGDVDTAQTYTIYAWRAGYHTTSRQFTPKTDKHYNVSLILGKSK